MAQSPEQMRESMIANMTEKTGKPLEAWLGVVSRSGLTKHGEILKFLKTEHGMTHGFANLAAHLAQGDGDTAEDDLIAAQYAGPKSALRPIYEALIETAKALGGDVEIAPKKTYVSLRRSKQFALIQPSTKTRVDLGLNLKDADPAGRLESSGSFNAMVSHRVRLTSLDDVDHDVCAWLKSAYDQA